MNDTSWHWYFHLQTGVMHDWYHSSDTYFNAFLASGVTRSDLSTRRQPLVKQGMQKSSQNMHKLEIALFLRFHTIVQSVADWWQYANRRGVHLRIYNMYRAESSEHVRLQKWNLNKYLNIVDYVRKRLETLCRARKLSKCPLSTKIKALQHDSYVRSTSASTKRRLWSVMLRLALLCPCPLELFVIESGNRESCQSDPSVLTSESAWQKK